MYVFVYLLQELNKRTTRTDDRLCVGSFELYDVRAIHVLLMQELNSAQTASAASQRQFVLEVSCTASHTCLSAYHTSHTANRIQIRRDLRTGQVKNKESYNSLVKNHLSASVGRHHPHR